jgi:hypothetical protein
MTRIVSYTPKRQRDAWAKYLRLTGTTADEIGHAATDR